MANSKIKTKFKSQGNKMKIKMIMACSYDNVIGITNEKGEHTLPWRIPEDIQMFRNETDNQVVVMGRTTFHDLPKVASERFKHIIVLSSEPGNNTDTTTFVNTVAEAMVKAKDLEAENLYVCGGAKVYVAFAHCADEIILTRVARYIENPNTVKVSERVFDAFEMNKQTIVVTPQGNKRIPSDFPEWIVAARSSKREIIQFSVHQRK